MRLPADWTARVIGLVLVTVLAGGLAALARRDSTVSGPTDRLVAAIDSSKVAAAVDSSAHVAAERATDAVADTLHQRVIAYDTVRRQVVLDPKTAADTARDMALLPVLVQRTDSLRAVAVTLDSTVLRERRAAARLDADRRRTIAQQDTLIDRLSTRPRLGGETDFLYDPIGHATAVSAQLHVRVVGNWGLVARADERFAVGERPRGYLGVRRTF